MRFPVASVASEVSQVLVSQVLPPRPHLPAHRGPAEADRSEAARPFEMLLDSTNGANEPAAAPRSERPDRPDRPERPERPERPDRPEHHADASWHANERSDAKGDNAAAVRKDGAEGQDAACDAKDANDSKDSAEAAAPDDGTVEQKPTAEAAIDANAVFVDTAQAPAPAGAQPVAPVAPQLIAVEAAAAAAADAAPEAIAAIALPVAGKIIGPEGAGPAEQPKDGAQAEGQAKAAATAGAPAPAVPEIAADQDGEKQNPDQRAANLAKAAENAQAAADVEAKPQKSAAHKIPQLGADAAAAMKGAADAVQNLGLTAPASQANAAANAAQINAATAASAQAPAAPVPLAELAVHIASQALDGKQRFEIRLDPPELGRIDVRIDVDRDGNVTSRLTVDRADTLDLLRRDAAQLERALQQAGLKTSDNALEFSLRQHTFGRDDAPSQNGNPLVVADDDQAPLEPVRQHYGRLLGLGGGLDIRV